MEPPIAYRRPASLSASSAHRPSGTVASFHSPTPKLPGGQWSASPKKIDAENFPYTGYALPFTANATLNSTSLIASLLHYAGANIDKNLPRSSSFAPGREPSLAPKMTTRCASQNGFNALFGGAGKDKLFGTGDLTQTQKFFGGKGDDVFNWPKGHNVYHGWQKGLLYEVGWCRHRCLRRRRPNLHPQTSQPPTSRISTPASPSITVSARTGCYPSNAWNGVTRMTSFAQVRTSTLSKKGWTSTWERSSPWPTRRPR